MNDICSPKNDVKRSSDNFDLRHWDEGEMCLQEMSAVEPRRVGDHAHVKTGQHGAEGTSCSDRGDPLGRDEEQGDDPLARATPCSVQTPRGPLDGLRCLGEALRTRDVRFEVISIDSSRLQWKG